MDCNSCPCFKICAATGRQLLSVPHLHWMQMKLGGLPTVGHMGSLSSDLV